MKRFTRSLSVVLVLVLCLGTVAYAQENTARSSLFFSSYSTHLYKTAPNAFEIWFDVVSEGAMDELGVSCIEVERSTDGRTWTVIDIFERGDYPGMIERDTAFVYSCLPYATVTGYYYRACVTYYAKNSIGTGTLYDYTSAIYLPPV